MGLNFRYKAWVFLWVLCCSSLISSVKATVTYDHKAVIINGQRRILLSGSIHYPRSTPEVFFNIFNYVENNLLVIYVWSIVMLNPIIYFFLLFFSMNFSVLSMNPCSQKFLCIWAFPGFAYSLHYFITIFFFVKDD